MAGHGLTVGRVQRSLPEYLTIEQVAERHQTSIRTVKRLMAAGDLPVVRLGAGGSPRIAREDLEAFEESRRRAA